MRMDLWHGMTDKCSAELSLGKWRCGPAQGTRVQRQRIDLLRQFSDSTTVLHVMVDHHMDG